MKAYIFPGQGSQFSGMGFELYSNNPKAKKLFELANNILEFDICKIMFSGSDEELKQTNVTQPAIFICSTILAKCMNNFVPDMVAGHSLGEFSALVAAKVLSFQEGLMLVKSRAEAMQIACEKSESTMAAIIGLEANIIEEICKKEIGIVVPANYNAPGQIVISGEIQAVQTTCDKLSKIGAKRTLILPVSGAFHSPLMEIAESTLKEKINSTEFKKPICPIYQNVCAQATINEETVKNNLIQQLTAPVKWYQTIETMFQAGAEKFIEVGPGNVLTGLNRRINREISSVKASI